jgi:hypothetical protein
MGKRNRTILEVFTLHKALGYKLYPTLKPSFVMPYIPISRGNAALLLRTCQELAMLHLFAVFEF